MQQLIIDCQTGKAAYIELSSVEEIRHLEEAQKNRIEAERLEQEGVKQLLLQRLVELREMKANPDVFTAEEVDKKQVEVDSLVVKKNLNRDKT